MEGDAMKDGLYWLWPGHGCVMLDDTRWHPVEVCGGLFYVIGLEQGGDLADFLANGAIFLPLSPSPIPEDLSTMSASHDLSP